MDYAWFIYTVALMAVALAASSTSVTVWVLTNRKDCLAAAAGDITQLQKLFQPDVFRTDFCH